MFVVTECRANFCVWQKILQSRKIICTFDIFPHTIFLLKMAHIFFFYCTMSEALSTVRTFDMYIHCHKEMQNKEVYLAAQCSILVWWFTRKWKQVDVCSYSGKRMGYDRMFEISVQQCWDGEKRPIESTFYWPRKTKHLMAQYATLWVEILSTEHTTLFSPDMLAFTHL